MKLSVRWLYPTAFVCLLLSGVAGLVYQVVWARYLALFLGHTSYAVVAVLVAFMGGLALGNAWLGRFADRLERPLALYAWLEIGIAVYALLFPVYFEFCQGAYVALGRGATPGSSWLLVLKFGFSFAAILIPTTLMGGTLPILTKLVTRSLGELRARVAGLYFVNSVGAVIGVLVADFWWIPAYGLDATVLGGAILNGVVGGIALLVSAGLREGTGQVGDGSKGRGGWVSGMRNASQDSGEAIPVETGATAGTPGVEADEVYSTFELRLAVAAAGVSGFVAMLYEVVWTRLLGLALGSSTHAFSIMLVTFITGIAMGAWLVGRWRGLRRTFDAFGWAELALALTLLGSMFFYHLLPYVFVKLGSMVARSPGTHGLYQAVQFLVCFGVMFIPALCLGMTLPLASRVATAELARTGRSVGLVFSVNTLGTVLGAALSGMVFLPVLGLARSFALGVGLNLAIALAVLLRRRTGAARAVMWGSPVLILGLMVMAGGALNRTWEHAFSLGLWRTKGAPGSLTEYLAMVRAINIRFYRDGAGASVAVNTWTNPATSKMELALRVNGKTDATTQGDLSTQVLLGHIPLLLKPDSQDVMVIGVGSGTTCASALTHPTVKHVDAVEISPEVVEAARTMFGVHNRGALDDPKVSVVLDDAKSFLKTSGRTYDVIISEPSNPWMAGVAGVFSSEFYDTCRRSLKPGGLMVQWVHIYESDDATLRTVLATVTDVFPFLTIWQTLPGDLVLVGSVEPTRYDLEAIQKRFDERTVTEDLRRADIFRLPVLLGLQLVSDYNAPFLVPADTVRHSDFFPTLEYMAERGFFVRDEATLYDVFNETVSRRPTTLLGEYLRKHPLTVTDMQSFALFHTTFKLPNPKILRSILERWREMAPDSTLVAEFSAKLDFPLPVSELEAQRMSRVRDTIMTNAPAELEPLRIYSRHLMHAYRYQRSAYYQPPSEELVKVLERLTDVDALHRQSHRLRLAEIAWDLGDDSRFVQLATEALLINAGVPAVGRFDLDYQAPGQVIYLMIETLWRAGRYGDALLWCRGARDGRYLEPGGRYYSPLLAMVVRKVEATAPASGSTSPPAEGGPGKP